MPKKDEKKWEEPKKLSKEERFAKIRALVNEQPEEEKELLLDLMEQEAKMDQNSMHIPLQYKVGTKNIETKALLDSGAGGRFISTKLARTLGRKWIQLPEKIKVFNIDGTANKMAWITHVVELDLQIAGREFRENFMISDIGDEEMILGLPWLRYHNSTINWKTGEIQFPLRRRIQIKRFRGVLDNTKPEVLIRAKIMASQEMAHQQQAWKAAFKTNRGLFEPMVMFFGLSNSLATFQAFMNNILSDFIDEGWCVVYMDDIFLFSKDQDEHRERMERLMRHLKKHDLFLKPEKCEFDVTEVIFLGMVIQPRYIAMDPVKLAGIAEWEPP
uniref:Putative reverse transcriptase-rnase h-integrase n=1 Tax=Moniliophthora roreri TaxID=221103 RepID=A0A0W0G1V4_MONRR